MKIFKCADGYYRYLYLITCINKDCPDYGMKYGGQHQGYNVHPMLDGYMGSSKYLKAAIKKYGRDSFEKIIVSCHRTSKSLSKAEGELVAVENAKNPMWYNRAPGNKFKAIGYSEKHFSARKTFIYDTMEKTFIEYPTMSAACQAINCKSVIQISRSIKSNNDGIPTLIYGRYICTDDPAYKSLEDYSLYMPAAKASRSNKKRNANLKSIGQYKAKKKKYTVIDVIDKIQFEISDLAEFSNEIEAPIRSLYAAIHFKYIYKGRYFIAPVGYNRNAAKPKSTRQKGTVGKRKWVSPKVEVKSKYDEPSVKTVRNILKLKCIFPDGRVEHIEGLFGWCRNNKISYRAAQKALYRNRPLSNGLRFEKYPE